MKRRQEQLQKLWEELILDNLDDLVKGAQTTLDSVTGSLKDATSNIHLDRSTLESYGLEALEAMDREELERWLRQAVRSLDPEKLEEWARKSLAAVDAGKYRRLVRNKIGELDKDKLDKLLKEGLRFIDRHKLVSRLRALHLEKFKEAARAGLSEIDPHRLEEYLNTRVDKVVRARLDALSANELELLVKEKRAAGKPVEIVSQEKVVDLPERKGAHPIASLLRTSFRMALLSAAGWIAYSHLFLEHQVPLPKAIAAELFTLAYRPSGPINSYVDRTGTGRPLVLIHSINAAASSYEMRPLFQHFRGERPVFALDLPGFGFSARSDIEYSPEIYVNAILTMLAAIDSGPADVVALSLSAEFAAEAARRRPDLFHSLALISPSGFYSRESNGLFDAYALPLLSFRLWSRPFFDLLTTKKSIAYFLQKSFAGAIPEGMVDYSVSTSHQPGAEHAPLYFVAGKLFTPNAIERIYRLVKTPTLVLYDRDSYVRFDRLPELLATNKSFQAARISPSLGLPQWEKSAETTQALENFWQSIAERV